MERRNRSLELLNELKYIDTLDYLDKAIAIEQWAKQYMCENFEQTLDLQLDELENLTELFYKNINFLKKYKDDIQKDLRQSDKIKKFFT